MVIELPPGAYRVVVRNASFAGAVRLDFEVRAGGTTTVFGRFSEADARSMLAEIESAAADER